MSEHITSSSELRGFVADNTGRRKIDTEASLELHVRAATQIDVLSQHINDLEGRITELEQAGAAVSAAAPAPPEDPSTSAMMLLRNAQQAADETLAEAANIRAQAETVLAQAEAEAAAKANAATAEARAHADAALAGARADAEATLAGARTQADAMVTEARVAADAAVADARLEAAHLVENAHGDAESLVAANQKLNDRVGFIQRQYAEKAGKVRVEAESLLDFARQVESSADAEMASVITDAPEVSLPEPAVLAPVAEVIEMPASAEGAVGDLAATTDDLAAPPAAAVAEAVDQVAAQELPPPPPMSDLTDAADLPAPPTAETIGTGAEQMAGEELPPPPPPPAPVTTDEPASASAFLPPPPQGDVLDLTEDQLADVLEGRSIDDDLFDDEVIDLTDDAEVTSDDFQFFGRD